MPRSVDPTMVSHRSRPIVFALVLGIAALTLVGCGSDTIRLRSAPRSPLAAELGLTSYGGPKATAATTQLLRVYNLSDELQTDYRPVLAKLQAINDREPSAAIVYAMSELAFLGAKKAEPYDKRVALDMYGASVLHAHDYLFDARLAATRNPYDPHYRGACDLYNGALEGALRIVCEKKELVPDTTKTINTASGQWDITCVLRGSHWRPEDFDRFEFVSDYDIKGLTNLYMNHGLGVPLIAIRRVPKEDKNNSSADKAVASQYYPAALSFPVTALIRPLSKIDPTTGQTVMHKQCVLELYDPLESNETVMDGQRVPLESDLTTPLAYFLSKSKMSDMATLGLLRPGDLLNPDTYLSKLDLRPGGQGSTTGLFMVQPYEPGKIPVLMVHGLWSTPMTWLEMFNDLRSQPEIRARYQFWFYLYPTGQPFWLSAARLRHDLIQVRETLDPNRQEPSLDQMVLIGHSMGGLVSRLQTLQSGDDYWHLVSNEPFSQIKADEKTREKLAETYYFQPNPSIRRVVTIGTPHRGSKFSKQTTQWLFERLVTIPQTLANSQQRLFRDNQGAFPDRSLLRIERSIDSLSPNTPIFPVMLAGRRAPWVQYHNIVGVVPEDSWLTKISGEKGDGVVSRESAHLDDAVSELTVPANHTAVHAHPAAVLEVRRILLEHLAALDAQQAAGVAQHVAPATGPGAVVRIR